MKWQRRKTPVERFWKWVEPDTNGGCLLWAGNKATGGYGQLTFGGKTVRAHRFSYILHVGPIADGLHVCHRCDVRMCVNPAHLFLGTRADNMADMVAKGRQRSGPTPSTQGERHYAARLAEADVLAIRASNARLQIDAARYGVSRSMISRIRLRQSWAHLAGPTENA